MFVVVACNLGNNIVKTNNIQFLKMFKTLKKITTDSEPKVNNMRWTDDMDDFLLNVMLEEQNNWNMPNQTWNSHAYSNMCKMCSIRFAMQFREITSRIAPKLWKILSIHVMTFSRTWVDLHGI